MDIGANVGDWIALALEINPAIHIHAFEPSRATYEKLTKRGFSSNVTCHNVGLGSAEEQRSLFVFEEGSALNSLYRRSGLEDGWGLQTQVKAEPVNIETLDGHCATHAIQTIDYLKVDVEGHELEVFKGANGMLRQRRIRTIQFEYGGCNIDSGVRLKDIFEFFQTLHYDFYKLHPRGPVQVPRYDQRFENFQYQNWALRAREG